MENALVIRGGAIGDLILTLPAIRAVQSAFPETRILANRAVAPLLTRDRNFLDDPELASFFHPDGHLAEKWRAYLARHDFVLSYLHDPDAIFETNVRRCGVTNFVCGPARVDERGGHATEQLAAPLYELEIPVLDLTPRLANEKTAYGSTSIALHPGSGSPRKNWPIDRWLQLAEGLLGRSQDLLIVGGEADTAQIASFRDRFGDRVSYAINRPLPDLVATLADTIFLGQDSGISHLALAAGAHCLTLFGPTNPAVWAPRGENARLLVAPNGDLSRLDPAAVCEALDQELMRIGIRT